MSFHSTRDIKAVRKEHVCEHCLTKIAIGEPAINAAGVYDGDFYSYYVHPECEAWGTDYAKRGDLWGDEYVWLHDVWSDIGTQDSINELRHIIEKFPKVAALIDAASRLRELEAKAV